METDNQDSSLFQPYPKTPRLFRDIVITEKLDGTNAQIFIDETGRNMAVGSRTRWITPLADNFGFARWCNEHFEELLTLGPGRHFGEWWGSGIQRGYGLKEKRFSLFNVNRWTANPNSVAPTGKPPELAPACCSVVPILYSGPFNFDAINGTLKHLEFCGSAAAPGFNQPEGIVVFHTAASRTFKVLLENDANPKGTE